jgi:hypothetical protein
VQNAPRTSNASSATGSMVLATSKMAPTRYPHRASYPMATANRAVPVAVTQSDSTMKATTTTPSPTSVGHRIRSTEQSKEDLPRAAAAELAYALFAGSTRPRSLRAHFSPPPMESGTPALNLRGRWRLGLPTLVGAASPS